jgi:hypothetical protein
MPPLKKSDMTVTERTVATSSPRAGFRFDACGEER